MTPTPWPLPADATTPPPACHVCGGPLPAQGGIFAQPHRYHRACYTAFHAAMNDKANLSKTIAEIRAAVDGATSERLVVIDLPLPPSILRPNRIAGSDQRAVTKARRRVRDEAGKVAASAWRGQYRCDLPHWRAVRAAVTFSGVSRQMDTDNAHGWLKSARDGIADALCGGSDHGWVWEEPVYIGGAKGVTITVTEATVTEQRDGVMA